MALIPYNDFFGDVDDLFERTVSKFFGGRELQTGVDIDFEDQGDHYELTSDVPGLDASDIIIEQHDGYLNIRTEKKTENQSRRGTYYKKERRQMQFTRTIKLPADANEEGIAATLNKGVLALTIPKAKSKSKPSKRIEIVHK